VVPLERPDITFRLLVWAGIAVAWLTRRTHTELWGPLWAMPTGLVLLVAAFILGGLNPTLGGLALLAGVAVIILALMGLLVSVFKSE
jgi:hypothetical protein